MTTEYQAHGKAGNQVAATPRAAALAYFAAFPASRKCNVIQGEQNGAFFTVRYGRYSQGDWPTSYKDVTRKTATELPA